MANKKISDLTAASALAGADLVPVVQSGTTKKATVTQVVTAALDGTYAAATTDVLKSDVTGDSVDRFVLNADGKQEWGPGDGALDVNLYRSAADTLKTDDSLVVAGDLTLSASDLITDTTTGTKIGTGATQKLGFYGATPVVQPIAVADATDAGSAISQLNALLAHCRTLGIIAT